MSARRYGPPRGARRPGRMSPGVAALLAVVAVAVLGGGAYALYHIVNLPCCDPCTSTGQLTVALGARANTPDPALPAELADRVTTTVAHQHRILVYRVDGAPTVANDYMAKLVHHSASLRKQEISNDADLEIGVIGSVKSLAAEADPLRALQLAAAATPSGGTVVLYDSGLQTVAPLDFRQDGMLGAKPADVVARLGKDNIPDLAGKSVVLMGLGYTASPQPTLSEPQRRNVIAIWQAIASAGHPACVTTLSTPPEPAAARVSSPTVSIVKLAVCSQSKLSDRDLGFIADKATLRDPVAAKNYLKAHLPKTFTTDQRVHLIGTTARWGGRSGQIRLSLERAQTIAGLLVDLGVDARKISEEGAGSYSVYYTPDNGPKGPLDPAAAASNRSVVLQLLCDS